VCPLGGARHMPVVCDGGLLVRRLGWYGETAASKCSIPTDCGETRTLASILRVTTHAAGSDCLNCHGRGAVPLSCAPQPASCPLAIFPGGVPGVARSVSDGLVCTGPCSSSLQHAHAVSISERIMHLERVVPSGGDRPNNSSFFYGQAGAPHAQRSMQVLYP
jgi:hypothetical protein